MKTEAELLSLVQRLYADMGREPAEIVRVKPLHGGWYNALIYEVIRADDAVVPIWHQDIEDANHDALTDALKAFAAPRAKEYPCPRCDQRMPEQAHYCSNCGSHLEGQRNGVAADNDDEVVESARRRSTPLHAAVMILALTCAAGSAAYWLGVTSPPLEAEIVQPAIPPSAPAAEEVAQPVPQPAAPSAPETLAAPAPPQLTPGSNTGTPYSKENQKPDVQNAYLPPVQSRVPQPVQAEASNDADRARERLQKEDQSRPVRISPKPLVAERIDTVYRRLAASQCAEGVAGLICRERLKFILCKDKWAEDPGPGMTTCRIPAHVAPLS